MLLQLGVFLLLSSYVAGVPWGPRSAGSWPVSRRFALESRTTAPPSCVGRRVSPVNVTLPDPTEIIDANDTIATATELASSAPVSTEEPAPTSSVVPDDTNSTDASASSAKKRSHPSFSSVSLGEFSSFGEWQSFCVISGGDFYDWDLQGEFGCINWAGIDATFALLPEADPCEQQHNADLMITFAKASKFKVKERIAQAIAYRKYPRSVVNILGVVPSSPYCLEIPINEELIGIYNEQHVGVSYGLYGGPNYPLISFGSEGTCPLGWTADVDACACVEATATASLSISDLATALSTEIDTATEVSETASATETASVEAETEVAESTTEADVSETATATEVDAAEATESVAIDGDVNDPNGR